MKVGNKYYEAIWLNEDERSGSIIDQRFLPFEFRIEELKTSREVYYAIKDMHLRGAPLIGAAGALGMYLAVLGYDGSQDFKEYIRRSAEYFRSSRPTAVNLNYAVSRQLECIDGHNGHEEIIAASKKCLKDIILEEKENCRLIGEFGLPLIEGISKNKKGEAVNILTHCNAGWLACIDYGTATAPVYLAHDRGIQVHVWVDETRPVNQGARLTAWELTQHGVPCTVITDNNGGHLMQHGMVDMVIVGSDRTTVKGDVANKTGTYLKALAAKDNNIPFYVALPSSTIDWDIEDGIRDIQIEKRDEEEVKYMQGLLNGSVQKVLIMKEDVHVANHVFDVTPAHLVTRLITERGICKPNKTDILTLFPDR